MKSALKENRSKKTNVEKIKTNICFSKTTYCSLKTRHMC